jgi:aromatic-L-amino-acid/L-tryptophan decarboxylase
MTVSILDRLRELEAAALPLEPNADERARMSRAVYAHVESLLEWLDTAPGYAADHGSAAALDATPIGTNPLGLQDALDLLARHVDRTSQNPTAAGFMAYIPVGSTFPAALGEFIGAVSNRFSGSAIGSAAAVGVENQVLRWLADVIGYPAGAGGNLLSGGSMANLSAIVVAREAAGLRARDIERAVVYRTDQVHHCVTKGLRVAGMAECVQRTIPVDARFRMDVERLNDAMAKDSAAGLKPWLVIGTAGTTDTGAVDPLVEIAAAAKRHGAWFHCDAAYGGPFALCEEGRSALAGIERSDSVVLDPHKGLYVPFGVGAILVKDEATMRHAYRFSASYISREGGNAAVAPMDLSPELSRPFRALRLWLPLQALGTAPFAAAQEEKLLLARYAHMRLQEMPGIDTGPAPDLSIVIFRARPPAGDWNDFNARLERAILENGRLSLSSTVLEGERWMRMAILAPRTHRATIDQALEIIGSTVQRLAAATIAP